MLTDRRFASRTMVTMAAAAVLVLMPALAESQTAAADGPTHLPMAADGHPDLQGMWGMAGGQIMGTYSIENGQGAGDELLCNSGNNVIVTGASLVVDPADGKIPYHPWAAAQRQEVLENHENPTKWEHVDPHIRCHLSGVPRVFYQGAFQILQPRGYVVILQEYNHGSRMIPLDEGPRLGENIKLWMGDSRGHWEGNTLVVEVTNLNDQTWFDIVGDFHSNALHVVERYTLVDAETITYEATFEDPAVFTRPWKMALLFKRNLTPDFELMESACHEGERNSQHVLHLIK